MNILTYFILGFSSYCTRPANKTEKKDNDIILQDGKVTVENISSLFFNYVTFCICFEAIT